MRSFQSNFLKETLVNITREFIQAGKARTTGRTGKRTIFRNRAGKGRKSYTFPHRRLEKLEKHFCHWTLFNHISIVTAVSNVRFQDCCIYRMSHKQSYHLPMITNISKSKDLIGPGPVKANEEFSRKRTRMIRIFVEHAILIHAYFQLEWLFKCTVFKFVVCFPPTRMLW